MSRRKRKKTPSLPSGDHRPGTTGHRSCQPTSWSHSPYQTNSLPPPAHSLSRHQAIAKNRPTATSVSWETLFFITANTPFLLYIQSFLTQISHLFSVRYRQNGSNVIFGGPLAVSRGSYVLFCGGLRQLSSMFLNVPKVSHICPQRSSEYLPGSMLHRSLSYRFSICFPHFSLSETEKEWKTSE